MPVHPDPSTARTTPDADAASGHAEHGAQHSPAPTVRRFTADGPIDVNVQNLRGDVTLRAEHTTAVVVTLTPHGRAAQELVDRMTIRFDHGRLTVDAPAGEADHVATGFGDFFRAFGGGSSAGTSWSERLSDGVRTLVRGAEGLAGQLAIDVVVPSGTRAVISTGIGDVRVDGTLGRLEVKSGTGDLRIERGAEESTRLSTGTGDIDAGPTRGGVRANTGTGDITLQQIDGQAVLFAGVGDVTVARACAGDLSARTGLGDIEVRVAGGTATRLDLATGFGERDVQLSPADGVGGAARTLQIEAKSGKGDVRILRA